MSTKALGIQAVFHSDKQSWCICCDVPDGTGISGNKKQFVDIWVSTEAMNDFCRTIETQKEVFKEELE
ncbi:hypothetical protein [Kamptonema sp. UHCC 0994]|uniref:hypothetical protein n=1 Tax=Kamptonema sp. UHCC 0994 TaxID=3031329 RepID=UPI0023B89792|nr:hypothetical protein [Kamptonema sp. UHCC 0994]MDF0554921.1 hypothetical protein [Kamptonema sp. UHCC 0994]